MAVQGLKSLGLSLSLSSDTFDVFIYCPILLRILILPTMYYSCLMQPQLLAVDEHPGGIYISLLTFFSSTFGIQ